MELFEFLKEFGLNANDIKARLSNKQILVNGRVSTRDLDLGNISEVHDQGFFIRKLTKLPLWEKHSQQIMFWGLENLLGTNIQNDLTEFLSDFKMIQISKDDIIFVKTSFGEDKEILEVEWNIEGESTFTREIDISTESNEELIQRLEESRVKVVKQLSNKGFLNNAPKFKVDAAQNRLEKIESQLKELQE
jgi:valyl-tRNA synthetase